MGGLECVITGLMDEFKGFFTKYRIRSGVGSIPIPADFPFHLFGDSYTVIESIPFEESQFIIPKFEELTHH